MGQGAGALKRKKERRKRQKQARRESNQAMYRKWSADGANFKSKRFSKNSKAKKGIRARVPDHGNVGCLDGNFSLNIAGLVRQKLMALAGYQNQWTSKYNKQVSKYIRDNWPSLEVAWAAHGITPVRSDIPKSYNEDNWREVA